MVPGASEDPQTMIPGALEEPEIPRQTASFITKKPFQEDPGQDGEEPDDSLFMDDDDPADDDGSSLDDDDFFGSIDAEREALAELQARGGGAVESSRSQSAKGLEAMAHALTAEYSLVSSDVPAEIQKIKDLTAREDAELFKDLDGDGVPDGMPVPGADGPELLEEFDDDITPEQADVMLGLAPGTPPGSSAMTGDRTLMDLEAALQLPYRDPDDPAPEPNEVDRESMGKIESRARRWLDEATVKESYQSPESGADAGDDDGEDGRPGKYVIHADDDYVLIEDYGDGPMPEVNPGTLDDLLNDAIDRGASDVHIAVDRPIKLRINGSLYSFMKYRMMRQADMETLITTAISFLSNEKRTYLNQRKSVDTSYTVERGDHAGERFRVHFMDEMNGTAIVMRHIRPQIFTPEEIGLPEDCVKWGDLSQGLILVTGPTGSGKSASLSSILHHIQMTRSKKIITLEEPIETTYPVVAGKADVIQREIPENCPSFTAGIRDAMREDPDVILVGEIRDFDTIDAALQASNTGHLTFATIHANSAPAVITRILDLAGADSDKEKLRSDLSEQLKGIMSQRLLLKPGNDGRVAVREIVKVGKRQKGQIKSGNVPEMMDDLKRRGEDMDSQMIELLLEGRTVLSSVHEACSDREQLDGKISMLPDEWKRRIILEASSASKPGDGEELDDGWDELAMDE